MEQTISLQLPLLHRVEVNQAAQCLLRELDCDKWYVAGRRQHLVVLHLERHGRDRFAAVFECEDPVEKGIYHGAKASSWRLIPLHGEETPSDDRLHEIQAHFTALA